MQKKILKENLTKVKSLSCDLRNGKEFPRSPRALLAGYVLAARIVDKCRAVLSGWQGEYESNCPVDQIWLKFTGIDYGSFRAFVATGANDEEISSWIIAHAKKRTRADIVTWNNKQRETRLSDLSPQLQEFLEDYIQQFLPHDSIVYRWFDVYDLEEGRM